MRLCVCGYSDEIAAFFTAAAAGGVCICFYLLGFFITFALSIHLKSIAWHGYSHDFSFIIITFFWVEPITQILIKFTYFHSFINAWIQMHTNTQQKQQTKWFLLMWSRT